ncbi:BRCA1-associated protein 2-domain-containing protein [Lipomyces starkeyi]
MQDIDPLAAVGARNISMPFRFHIVFDLLPGSIGSDKWVNAVIESHDLFTTNCVGEVTTVADSDTCEVPSKTLIQQFTKFDKRFGRIEVLAIDLEGSDGSSAVVNHDPAMSSTEKKNVNRATVPPSPRARFLGSGVIHLYRDGEEETTDIVSQNQADVENSETPVLAILAVPGYMTASDLLGFVGKDCRDTISHFRMLRSSAPNRYMVLMRFREKLHADIFYRDYNCKMFNSMEPETCHVVYINSIRFHKSTFPEFPYLLDDEFTPLAEHQIASENKSRNRATSVAGPSVLTKPTPPPTRALRELPTCPVCLERMDSSVTGLLTIICQHTFHCQCLSKWGDNSCPVCRYSQKKDHQSQLSEPNQCSACGAVQNLWICLICGNIGCGRYDEAHAFQHYMDSDHVYAMDLESQRVWDYASDGYVHRLVQNQSDGKLVELPSLAASSADTGGHSRDEHSSGDYVPREKLDSIGMEYTYLLTSQLESQRAYFEDKIAAAADKASAALEKAEKAERDAAEAQAKLSRAKMENDELKGIVPSLEMEHEKMKRKSETLQAVSKKLEKEWRDEKSMNESMLKKLEFLIQDKAQKEKEIEELKDQLRDVMLYLDAQQKFQGMEEEVQQGTVSVGESPSSKKKKGRVKK